MINENLPLLSSSSSSQNDEYDHYSASSIDSFHECRSHCSIEEETPILSSSSVNNSSYGPTENTFLDRKSSLQQTIWNIAKMCMGTGTLALPYAASQGGYLFNAIGLLLIMLWNLYSVDRLLQCLPLLQLAPIKMNKKKLSFDDEDYNKEDIGIRKVDDDKISSTKTSTLEKITFHAFGSFGVGMVDGISLCLYFGVITAYIDAMLGFLSETPVTTGSIYMDGILLVIVLAPLSFASDLNVLSRFSAMGIFILISVYVTLAISIMTTRNIIESISVSWVDLWPKSLIGVCNWFGIVSFSMGVVPFTYTIQESMEKPKDMKRATDISVWLIFVTYLAISDGLAILISPKTNHDIESDILQLFPRGWIPTFVRLAMTLVIIVTVPLIIIPAVDLLESKFGLRHSTHLISGRGKLLRLTILLMCACLSFMVHNNFVHIVSFVGCLCVAAMSFVYPPFVHLVLYARYNQDDLRQARKVIIQDSLMLFWGCFSSIFTSSQTLYTIIK